MMKKFLLGWLDAFTTVLSELNKVFCISMFAGAGFALGVLFVLCITRIIVG